jgi:hypothetical protein
MQYMCKQVPVLDSSPTLRHSQRHGQHELFSFEPAPNSPTSLTIILESNGNSSSDASEGNVASARSSQPASMVEEHTFKGTG